MLRSSRLLLIALLVAQGVAAVSSAAPPRELLLAARNGDLAAVRALVEGGLPVDSADPWGTTALALAARWQQTEVVRWLLDRGADPSAREGFFGASVLDFALWTGAPDFEIARMLLAAGAEDRAAALRQALRDGDPALARAAAASGPVSESEAAGLRELLGEDPGELAEIVAALATRPDPPPPSYSPAELAALTGSFESRDGEATAEVVLIAGRLRLEHGGERTELVATGERRFRGLSGKPSVRYFGRAGSVEGLVVERPDGEPLRLRLGADGATVAADQLALSVPPPPAEPTVHWPGFRGANRSGIGDGAEPPVELDLASGAGVAWRVALPGLGNSSPVVWGDRVYVTTAVAEGGSVPLKTGLTGAGDEVEEARPHQWLVLAFDKASGEEVWRTEVGRGVPLTKRHFKATQANSTPATDGRHLVVVFPTAGLACLGLDGEIHWKRELGGLNAGGFNDPGLEWGFAASPVIHDGRVILQVDIHEGPYLAAWDLETGEPLWRTERPDVAPSWATPAIWPTPAGDELVVNASIIRGYDPASGEELWSLAPTSVQVVASPVVGRERLYVSSGYPPARPIYAVLPGIRGHHQIERGRDDPALAWHRQRGGAYMPTPLLYRGLLYVVHHNGRLEAHDAATGGTVYRARFSQGGTNTASPVAANGIIYQGTEEGTLYLFAAGPEYRELAAYELGAPLMATPAISQGMLLVRTPDELIALARDAPRGAAAPAEDG